VVRVWAMIISHSRLTDNRARAQLARGQVGTLARGHGVKVIKFQKLFGIKIYINLLGLGPLTENYLVN